MSIVMITGFLWVSRVELQGLKNNLFGVVLRTYYFSVISGSSIFSSSVVSSDLAQFDGFQHFSP